MFELLDDLENLFLRQAIAFDHRRIVRRIEPVPDSLSSANTEGSNRQIPKRLPCPLDLHQCACAIAGVIVKRGVNGIGVSASERMNCRYPAVILPEFISTGDSGGQEKGDAAHCL